MPATATKPAPMPETHEPRKARRVREMVVGAIEAGRELTASEAKEINDLFVGDQVASVTSVVNQFATDVAAGARLENFRPLLQNLLDGGAAGAIYNVAKHRHSLQREFEKTAFYKRKLELLKTRDERLAELTAAEANEDSTRAKLTRLREEYTDASKLLNEHLNSRDESLVAYRRAMEPTSVPTFNGLDWRMFKI